MNLDFVIDQNHSYRRAIEVAYEKAKRNGGLMKRLRGSANL